MTDPYGSDVLARDPHDPRAGTRTGVPQIVGELDLVVECADTGWCGAVVGWEKGATGWAVILEDRHGRRRPFALLPAAFLFEGRTVTLVRPTGASSAAPARTASGSVAVTGLRARTARGSRIWVEGSQDAQLVERVWGDDLRIEGVVVEHLGGIDDLYERVRAFAPDAHHRIGVLVDHLVPGSKEQRIADAVMSAFGGDVLVLGHPYVDVWQAVRPEALGISGWPSVPKGQSWKSGVCAALGWPDDHSAAWRRILASVDDYAELEPALLGRVEELIDFVTAEG